MCCDQGTQHLCIASYHCFDCILEPSHRPIIRDRIDVVNEIIPRCKGIVQSHYQLCICQGQFSRFHCSNVLTTIARMHPFELPCCIFIASLQLLKELHCLRLV